MDEQDFGVCYYCSRSKPASAFSFEHIWPDALGGDYLSDFWHTREVCSDCNSMSGVFVDGQFMRGWGGRAERTAGVRQYLSLNEPMKAVMPLDYLGMIDDPAIADDLAKDEVADWWAGPCGAHIVHFRPLEKEDMWTNYLGGDPRAKGARAGRAYINLASNNNYWVIAALASFKKHFERATRYVVTPGMPPQWSAFRTADREDPMQTADLRVMDAIAHAARVSDSIRAQTVIGMNSEHRFLAKLALAVGCKLFGAEFSREGEGSRLRAAFRMPDPERRKAIPVMGAGYFGVGGGRALDVLTWSGGWVLIVQLVGGALALSILTPSGRFMTVKVADDPTLMASLSDEYRQGQVWVTVPSLGRAVGPISLPDYVAHMTRTIPNAALSAIEAVRIDPAMLPPC